MRGWLAIGGFGFSAFGVVAALAGGCSSTPPAPYPDVQSFCQAKAQAECQVSAICGQSSSDSCVSARQSLCMSDAASATAGGGRAYTQGNAQGCVNATLAAFAPAMGAIDVSIPYSAAAGAPSLENLQTTCDAVFQGSAAVGASCKSTNDCAQPMPAEAGTPPQVVCSPVAPGSTVMQCAMAQNVAAGQPCANIGSVCPTGYYCTGTPARCSAGASVGGTCTPTVGCASGGFCRIPAGGKSGTCITGGGANSSCMSNANCGPTTPYCDFNQSGMGSATGVCDPGLVFSVGAPDCRGFGG